MRAFRKDRGDDDEGAFRDDFDVTDLTDDQIAALEDRLGSDDDDDAKVRRRKHEVEDIADLLVMANPNLTKQRALHHLLHNKNGAALVARMRKALTNKRKDTKPVDKMSALETFVKSRDGNMLSICKHIVDGGEAQMSEASFTKLATDAAQLVYPNDRPDVAFSKYFQADQVVREAHHVVKQLAIIMPAYVGDAAVDVDNPEDALAQLEALVAQQRAARPEMAELYAKNRSSPRSTPIRPMRISLGPSVAKRVHGWADYAFSPVSSCTGGFPATPVSFLVAGAPGSARATWSDGCGMPPSARASMCS